MEKYRYQKERISDQILKAGGSHAVRFLWDEHKRDLYFVELSLENMRQLLTQ